MALVLAQLGPVKTETLDLCKTRNQVGYGEGKILNTVRSRNLPAEAGDADPSAGRVRWHVMTASVMATLADDEGGRSVGSKESVPDDPVGSTHLRNRKWMEIS